MEGLTGYVFRDAINRTYGGIDKFFTPFIVPTIKREFKTRELRDILPENNIGMDVVPQILTNNSELFMDTVNSLKKYGYKEVNLNLGCPSGTVVTKCKGAGFLGEPERLDRFLDEIFHSGNIAISIKTRIGMENEDEFSNLIEIYNKYPVSELIVHPRLRIDYYKNPIRLECFEAAYNKAKMPLCYNGDILTNADYTNICEKFPKTDAVMIGRGLIANPNLAKEIKSNESGSALDLKLFMKFHNELIDGYIKEMGDKNNVLRKMKEMWFYLENNFVQEEKLLKKIKKSKNLSEYESYVKTLLT